MRWEILDCTLRDGGYHTNWDFDENFVAEYVNTIRDLPVSRIELGYRNPPQAGYAGRYYYVSADLLDQLISSGMEYSRLGAMLDAKLAKPSDMHGLFASCRGRLGFIRLAVQPNQIGNALGLAAEIKNLGFKTGINLMYMHNQQDLMMAVMEIESHTDAVDWVSLVDSFGTCFPETVHDSIKKVKSIIPHKIGFHGHDNLNLAFANTLAAITAGADIIDSTILGMGRGAGNLKTELLLIYWSKLCGKHIDLSDLGCLLELLRSQFGHHDWGTNLPYMISGMEALPQKDVMHWVGMRRYSTSTIIDKLRAGSAQIPRLHPSGDPKSLSNIVGCDQPCLILGGGATVAQHASALKEFALHKRCIVIHSSLKSVPVFAGVELKQYACLPGDEYRRLKKWEDSVLARIDGFVVCQAFNVESKPQYNYCQKTFALPNDKLDFTKNIQDSPINLSLGSALQLSLNSSIYIAGFDGYSHENIVEHEIEMETQLVLDEYHNHYPEFVVTSITPTSYNINRASVYALLQDTASVSN